MSFGRMIDAAIEPFAPFTAARRRSARIALDQMRQFDAAQTDRRTQGWRRPSTNADRENAGGLIRLRDGAEDLVRNNKYAAAGVRQIVANMVGDGIVAQAVHSNKKVQRAAQDDMDRFAESRVDGFGDLYENQKLAARAMVVRGEAINVWKPDDRGPDGRLEGREGDYLDPTKTEDRANGVRIVQGVEYDAGGDRVQYWMFDRHPGDYAGSYVSKPVAAQHVDHVFERLRFGQTRGVSWLAAVALTLRDVADIEDAVRLKKKVEACMALVITPPEGQAASPLTGEQADQVAGKPPIETVRPGMIFRAQAGETAQGFIPTSTGDGVDFIRHQLAGVSANMTPYHLMTGDVSQANYSSLRAAMLGHWALLDDWQQNVMVPRLCRPAFDRRMRRKALETGDARFLQVRATFAMPVRRQVDPLKDLMAEIMEIRAGLKLITKGLAERGINSDEHMKAIQSMNAIIDEFGLALDTDPRRLTDSGVLQAAVGYLAKTQPAAA